jgi:hypothetical protein
MSFYRSKCGQNDTLCQRLQMAHINSFALLESSICPLCAHVEHPRFLIQTSRGFE